MRDFNIIFYTELSISMGLGCLMFWFVTGYTRLSLEMHIFMLFWLILSFFVIGSWHMDDSIF